jgi:hypothetical protein
MIDYAIYKDEVILTVYDEIVVKSHFRNKMKKCFDAYVEKCGMILYLK